MGFLARPAPTKFDITAIICPKCGGRVFMEKYDSSKSPDSSMYKCGCGWESNQEKDV